jgi:nucleoside 2-deoxyribosyltransferase
MYVYLAGLIQGSVIDQCIGWRKQIVQHYSDWKGTGTPYKDLFFLDPCNGEDNVAPDGLSSNIPSKVILDKDYNAIKKCDLFVANMENFGVSRPLLGTTMEIAFAYGFHKPIIMVTKEEVYRKHPFVSNMVSWYFDSVEEMLERKAINQFYKSQHSAQY